VFIDESAVTTKMVRSHARALEGERACGSAPFSWERVTMLGALGLEGMIAIMTVMAGTTIKVFIAFLENVLLPALKSQKPNAILVMDNLSAHRSDKVRKCIESAGFTLKFLPRYSPDFSPIEGCWSKMKTILRGKEARTVDEINRELPIVLEDITAENAKAWFGNSGYTTPK
jgi:transposase